VKRGSNSLSATNRPVPVPETDDRATPPAAPAQTDNVVFASSAFQSGAPNPFPVAAADLNRFRTPRAGDGVIRLLDIALSSLILLLIAPLLATIALLVKATSPGPALFAQVRYGRFGQPFRILKFRTMRVMNSGAEKLQQATRNDPRVTGIGKFLRRTSLDELPQLINVLFGDMSLVGPRPHPITLDHEWSARIARYGVRFCVRPGITGLAQVRGFRGEILSDDHLRGRVLSDIDFVRRRSPGLYLAILIKTIVVVLFQDEAY
jgi:lipopolysaccharide/colanic/teichoic acid biosynthesis glycosyltransferase